MRTEDVGGVRREGSTGRLGWASRPLNTSACVPSGVGAGARDCEVPARFKGPLWLLRGEDTDAPDRRRVLARPRGAHLNTLLSGAGSLSSRTSPLSPTGISCLAWRTGALRKKRRKKVLNSSGSNPMMNIFHQTTVRNTYRLLSDYPT